MRLTHIGKILSSCVETTLNLLGMPVPTIQVCLRQEVDYGFKILSGVLSLYLIPLKKHI